MTAKTLAELVSTSAALHRAYVAFVQESGPDAIEVRCPALDEAELAALAEAAGGDLPPELAVFLGTAHARVALGCGPAAAVVLDEGEVFSGASFAWLDNAQMLEETKQLRSASETYGWDVPPCVVLSAESSEVVAYVLDGGVLIHVSSHDDGEIQPVDLDFEELLGRVAKAQRLQVEIGYGN